MDTKNFLIEAKDENRIAGIISKSKGNSDKAQQLAANMAGKIGGWKKAMRRAYASEAADRMDLAMIFAKRAMDLGMPAGAMSRRMRTWHERTVNSLSGMSLDSLKQRAMLNGLRGIAVSKELRAEIAKREADLEKTDQMPACPKCGKADRVFGSHMFSKKDFACTRCKRTFQNRRHVQ